MNHLVRMTKDDYRDYRRTYMSVNYSFEIKGQPKRKGLSERVKEFYNDMVLSMLESGTFEFYFLKDESEKIIGYTILSFPENKCIIEQFAVLEEGKGLGSLLFQKTLEIVKFKKLKKITLWCPFLGAQEFWKKMGFKRIIGSGKANENLLKQAGASSLASIDNGFELSIKQ